MQLVFLTCLGDDELRELDAALQYPMHARTLDDLARLDAIRTEDAVLLSFATSVIVPADLLGRYKAAYNLHAASPDYPGRDPHHFAVYEGAGRYGATLHVMTRKVDDGPIVDVEWFDVPEGTTPAQLLERANEAAQTILFRTGSAIARGETPPPLPVSWCGPKRKRSDFLEKCRIPLDISEEEFARRYFAFDGGNYANLTVEVAGHTFRIER